MFGDAGRQSNGDSPINTTAKHTVSILPLQSFVVARRQRRQQVRVSLFSSISIILKSNLTINYFIPHNSLPHFSPPQTTPHKQYPKLLQQN